MNILKLENRIGDDGKSRRVLYLLLSYLLPLILMLGALAGLQIAPFGDHTLLISDANGYYINTLSYSSRMFSGLESALYSFEKGLGGNMIGHFNGILLTPFAFLLALFDIMRYPSVYSFISVLNLSLCGLTMYLFLADQYGPRRSHLIFSTTYALMGFNVANVFQAVFFCAAPVLPIMALGLKRLLRGKSPLLYMLSLTYSLLMNAYFGFVMCVASVLFFLTEVVVFREEYGEKRIRLFVHYALASLFGGLLAAALWIPSFLSLQGGRLEQTSLKDFSFVERQPLLEIGSKLFIGANSTDELVNGHPNIYVGLLPVALCILFFLNRNVDKRKKAAAGVLLGVFLLSFTVRGFDMLMHAGTTTNWFNFRYSYVFSFLMLTISASQWEHLEETPQADFRRSAVLMLSATALVFFKRYDYVYAGEVLIDFAILCLIYLAFWMRQRRPEHNPQRLFELVTLLLVCVALFLNYRICTKNIRQWETTETSFRETVLAVDPMIQGITTADESFYRMEVTPARSGTGNDPMLYGYNGVGHGGSNERDFVRREGFKLGIPWFSNRSFYFSGVPAATDTLLGLKYMVSKSDLAEEKGYEKRVTLGEYSLYQNPDALQIAVLSADGLAETELDYSDVFANLNAVWAALSGEEKPVFVEENDIDFTAHVFSNPSALTSSEAREIVEKYDAEASASDSSSKNSEDDGNEPPQFTSYIEYSFTAARSGAVYVYNRALLSELNGSALPVLEYVGTFEEGEPVTGYLTASSLDQVVMEEWCGRFRAVYADAEALHELSELIRSRPVTINKEKETLLTGSFTAQSGQTLLFTIPWDEGWSLYIDGVKTELREVLGIFLAADAPAGTHSYEMRFEPTGLRLGLVVSACALLLALVYIAFGRKQIDLAFKIHAADLAEKAAAAEEQTPEDGEEDHEDPV